MDLISSVQVILPSPRTPTAVYLSLLEQTQCSMMVHLIEVEPVAKTLEADLPGLQCEQLPLLDELLAAPANQYKSLQNRLTFLMRLLHSLSMKATRFFKTA